MKIIIFLSLSLIPNLLISYSSGDKEKGREGMEIETNKETK